MYQVIIVVHVLLGLGIIGLILMQQGKGADAGAAFGSGSSGSVFGAQGAASFLSRTTAIFATLFFTTSLTLAILGGQQSQKTADLMDSVEIEQKATDVPSASKTTTPENIAIPETDTSATASKQPDSIPLSVDVDNKAKADDNKAVVDSEEHVASEKIGTEKKHDSDKKKTTDKSEKKHDSDKKKVTDKSAKKQISEKKKVADKSDKKHNSDKKHKSDKHD
jgi:preprotein translocase subunit SecG